MRMIRIMKWMSQWVQPRRTQISPICLRNRVQYQSYIKLTSLMAVLNRQEVLWKAKEKSRRLENTMKANTWYRRTIQASRNMIYPRFKLNSLSLLHRKLFLTLQKKEIPTLLRLKIKLFPNQRHNLHLLLSLLRNDS